MDKDQEDSRVYGTEGPKNNWCQAENNGSRTIPLHPQTLLGHPPSYSQVTRRREPHLGLELDKKPKGKVSISMCNTGTSSHDS